MNDETGVGAHLVISSLVADLSKLDRFHSGSRHTLYRGCISGTPIVVKVSSAELPRGDAVASSRHEYDLLRELKLPGIIRVLGLAPVGRTGRTGRSTDWRTDLYSLGATFYEMLTGAPPFAAGDAVALAHAQIARRARSPHEINSKAENAVLRAGHLEPGMSMMTKPFSIEAMAARIKALIEE